MDEPCMVLHQSPVVGISYYSLCILNHIHFFHVSQTQLGLLFMGFLKHNTSKGSAYEHSNCIAPNLFLGIMTWLALDNDWVIRYGVNMRLWTVPFAVSAPAPYVSTWLLSPLFLVCGVDLHEPLVMVTSYGHPFIIVSGLELSEEPISPLTHWPF